MSIVDFGELAKSSLFAELTQHSEEALKGIEDGLTGTSHLHMLDGEEVGPGQALEMLVLGLVVPRQGLAEGLDELLGQGIAAIEPGRVVEPHLFEETAGVLCGIHLFLQAEESAKLAWGVD